MNISCTLPKLIALTTTDRKSLYFGSWKNYSLQILDAFYQHAENGFIFSVQSFSLSGATKLEKWYFSSTSFAEFSVNLHLLVSCYCSEESTFSRLSTIDECRHEMRTIAFYLNEDGPIVEFSGQLLFKYEIYHQNEDSSCMIPDKAVPQYSL